ncbi:MAG: hypothetical protein FJX06_13455 [Alphaproteobacteria bacterium]|nr:hypothetical protein [Alphaproteobacteria bacterium]
MRLALGAAARPGVERGESVALGRAARDGGAAVEHHRAGSGLDEEESAGEAEGVTDGGVEGARVVAPRPALLRNPVCKGRVGVRGDEGFHLIQHLSKTTQSREARRYEWRMRGLVSAASSA